MNLEEKTKNQGTRQPEASQQEVNGDMAWEELVELDDVQLATIVGGGDGEEERSASRFGRRGWGRRRGR
jgi:hypothetical protein